MLLEISYDFASMIQSVPLIENVKRTYREKGSDVVIGKTKALFETWE